MARGWESKSIESQQSDARDAERARARPLMTDEERARAATLAELRLSHSRVLRDLEGCRRPNHRATLESALGYLEAEIRKLEDAG